MDLLTCFKLQDCNLYATPFQSRVKLSKTCQNPKFDATLYQKLVGSLTYLTHSSPNISFVVSMVYHFMQDPREIQ
jgi:hypothetical protein